MRAGPGWSLRRFPWYSRQFGASCDCATGRLKVLMAAQPVEIGAHAFDAGE